MVKVIYGSNFTAFIPSVSVSAPVEVLYAGTTTPLTLTCNVTTDPSLADSVNVSVTWLRGISQLSNATSRVSISSLSRSQSTFTSTLTVYPLSINDATNFTCRAGIVPLVGGGLNSTTASGTVFIVVEGKLVTSKLDRALYRARTPHMPLHQNCTVTYAWGGCMGTVNVHGYDGQRKHCL